jgi:hypothetical protein
MAVLSAAKIKAANDKKILTVPVEEWGGDVCIRNMSGLDRDAIGEAQDRKAGNFVAFFLSLVLCDEEGNKLFTGDEGVKTLNEKSNAVLQRLFEAAWEHNRLSPGSVEAMGESGPSDQRSSSTTN